MALHTYGASRLGDLLLLIWNAFLIAFTALLPLVRSAGLGAALFWAVGRAKPEVYRSLARRSNT